MNTIAIQDYYITYITENTVELFRAVLTFIIVELQF